MKRIDRLDFLQPRPTPWAGWALAVLGLAALSAAALPLWTLQQDNLDREQRLATLSAAPVATPSAPTGSAAARATTATTAADKRDNAQARELLQRLNAPWAELFGLLEQHASADIGLLQVEPDAVTRQVRITALSRDLPGMVAWLRQLQADTRLVDVLLQQHRREEQTPGQPVRFTLSARWRALPPVPPAALLAPRAASAPTAPTAPLAPSTSTAAPTPPAPAPNMPRPAQRTDPAASGAASAPRGGPRSALVADLTTASLDIARSLGGPR